MLNHLAGLDASGRVLVQSQTGWNERAGIGNAESRMGESQNSLKL
jgi:hypothetical protein